VDDEVSVFVAVVVSVAHLYSQDHFPVTLELCLVNVLPWSWLSCRWRDGPARQSSHRAFPRL